MEINLATNDVLKNESTGEIFRVIDIDHELGEIGIFQCHSRIEECEFPFIKTLEEIHGLIGNKKLKQLDEDPFARLERLSSSPRFAEITEQTKIFFDVLESYPIEDLMIETMRWQIIKKASQDAKIQIVTAYKWIKKYFNNGMTESALDPDYNRCGAPGKDRNSGIPIEYRKYVLRGYKRFHLDKAMDLRSAWRTTKRTYKKHFKDYKLPEHVFRFIGERKYSVTVRKEKRLGPKNHRNNHSAQRGRSNDIAHGPCVVYQIDSTTRDIQLVSSLDRNQFIGKATFYIVTDLWSRAIMSVYITLDNPSYSSAANALYLAFTDKQDLYNRVELDLKYLRFNPKSVPIEIHADGGELKGTKSQAFLKNLKIKALGITRANTPIQKGNVERLIDTIQDRVRANFLERGQVMKDDGNRGATNTQEQACITLKKLIQITLITVDEYNNNHVIVDYPLTEEMVKDKVNKIPAEIYRWGIRKKLGRERHVDKTTLWYSLLHQHKISASARGVITFNKQKYVPVDKEQQDLLIAHVLENKGEKINISFDPRNYRHVGWLFNGKVIQLRLLGKDDIVFDNEWEVLGSNSYYSKQDKDLRDAEESVREANDEFIDSIISEGMDESSQIKVNTEGARSAKALEKELERQSIAPPETPNAKTNSKQPSSKQNSKWLSKLKKANH